MIKKVKFFILLIINITGPLNPLSLKAADDNTFDIKLHTGLIFRRFYFISRLENTIKLLANINQRIARKIAIEVTNIHSEEEFLHPRIIDAFHAIRAASTIKPLFAVWGDFTRYLLLNVDIVVGKNDIFLKDLSKKVLFIAESYIEVVCHTSVKRSSSLSLAKLSPEAIINLIDKTLSIAHGDEGFLSPSRLFDINTHASTITINDRFYYIARLKPHIKIFKKIKKYAPKILELSCKRAIKKSLHNKHSSKSLQNSSDILLDEISIPATEEIEGLWKKYRQYKKIDDNDFTKQFCILLLNVFKGISHNSGNTIATNIAESLEIEDILHLIDVISKETKSIAQLYKNKKESNITSFIKKNWLKTIAYPSVAITTTIVYMYLYKKSTIK